MSANAGTTQDTKRFISDALKVCLNLDCFNPHSNKSYCSIRCSAVDAARISGDKRRGMNPNEHIRVRLNGARPYLHRVIVERERGAELDFDSIVHHRDERKHHNCYGLQLCEVCMVRLFLFIASVVKPCVMTLHFIIYSYSNLEVLTDDAAREHIYRHQRRLQAARKKKGYGRA